MMPLLAADSRAGRGLLAATVAGSGMAMLDLTVVNVALRRIGTDLGSSVSQLQWVVNAYMVALAALILLGGVLGDRFGRRRVYAVGTVWFAAASAACALAPGSGMLIAARFLQGMGAALLTPGSLALIQASMRQEDRAATIGRWAGLTGIAAALGPLLGGWVVDVVSWRWIFALNVPLAVVALSLTLRCVPESRDEEAGRRLDASGAALSVLGLGALSYALIEARTVPVVVVAVAAGTGLAALAVFLLRERRHPNPVLPLHLFASRAFSVSNAMTLLVYGALGAMLFFLVLQLQESLGFSPLRAGLATVPLPLTMLVLSSRSGALAQRIGPRPQLTAGPIASAVGAFMLSGVGPDSEYVADVLPGLVVFSLGLVTLVAPVTATVLAAAPQRFAGTASGVNNAVARTGSLLAVAGLPALVGLTGGDYTETAAMTAGYADALRIAGVVLLGGGLLGYLGLRGVPRPGGGSDRPSTTGRTQE